MKEAKIRAAFSSAGKLADNIDPKAIIAKEKEAANVL